MEGISGISGIESLIHTTAQMSDARILENNYNHNAPNSPQQSSATLVLNPNNICQWKGCYQKYNSTKDLFEHVKEQHVGRKRNGHVNLQCFWSDCKAEFPKRYDIISHIHVHIPYEPFVCDICKRNFKRKSDMVKHQKLIHSNPNVSMIESSPNSQGPSRSPSRIPMNSLISGISPPLRIRPASTRESLTLQTQQQQDSPTYLTTPQKSDPPGSSINGIFMRNDIPSIESILGEIKSNSSISFTKTGTIVQ